MKNRKAKFSGHQTFVARYGWLEKGYRFASDGKSFTNPEAIVELGVGKNMVDSIRYWIELSGITSSGKTSEFGKNLLDSRSGWDPFLEDNNSYWLLHWMLNTHPHYIHAGMVLFSYLRKPEFDKRQTLDSVIRLLDSKNIKSPSENIIYKDIDCYLRLYAGTRKAHNLKEEELLGSPFQELNLIQMVNDSDLYSFNIGNKINLAPEIIAYAIWDYMHKQKKIAISLNEALYREFSPGLIFMLDENSIVEAVEHVSIEPQFSEAFGFSEAGGIASIHCSLEHGNDILNHYYKKAMYA